MQALASKASTAFGVALGLMLTLLGGLALLGFGLYLAAQHLLAGIYDILGRDVATLLFAVLIVTIFVALVCVLIAACVRLGFWLYGIFGRTHATVMAAYEDARLARVDAGGVPPCPAHCSKTPASPPLCSPWRILASRLANRPRCPTPSPMRPISAIPTISRAP